ncbi:MAG: methyltransferase domain-containing protein [Reichenbachiella sp.]
MLRRLINSLNVLIGKATISQSPGHLYDCNVCENEQIEFKQLPFHFFRELQKNQYIHSIFCLETINIEHYSCSKCGASDRDRLIALHLNEIKKKNSNVLDFAPSNALTHVVKKNITNYRSTDLYMTSVDDNVDITNMNIYSDQQFDFILCSHILEHVQDDMKAMSELFRILKNDGEGIILVPISLHMEEDYENKNVTTDEDRWKHFGQDDHVRQYSKKGFLKKLRNVGFTVRQLDEKYFGVNTFKKYAIYPTSVLYIVTK